MKKLLYLLCFSTLVMAQEYKLDQNTIGLWHCNENSGTTVFDSSPNQANGSLEGNPQWVEGKFGSGILLNGLNDYVSFQKNGMFDFNRGSFAIEFWIKIISNDRSDNKIIFTNREDITTGQGLIIWIDVNNTLNARLTDYHGIGQPLVGPILDFNRWYNIAFVRDSVTAKMIFFVDGYKASDILDPTDKLESIGPFYFGRAGRETGWETSCINALIDEIRISNTARVGTNVDELYDLFPIRKGNQYNYNYHYSGTTYHVGSLEYIQNDDGIISYSIIDSTFTGNKVDWLVNQKINLLRNYITYETDTLYSVQNEYNFILTESLNGNHELTANPPTWDSTGAWGDIGIWKFPVQDNNAVITIYRFYNASESIISNNNYTFPDSLWFDIRGLYKRTYYYEYLGNHQEYHHTNIRLDSVIIGVKKQILSLPRKFYMLQNYPNPFNPSTKISWQSPVNSWQTLKVYDLLGREVATLVNEYRPAGAYEIEFNPESSIKQPASGVYFYRLKSGSFIETKKMILLK